MVAFSKLQSYVVATLACALALVVARPIDAPASCFLLAVTMSNLFGKLGSGLLSVGLSGLAFYYFFLRTTFAKTPETDIILRFATFLAAALLITGLMEMKRRAEASSDRAEEALRHTQADLQRISRITTMGELTASLAHEVNQPIAAAITDANTCLRWLNRDQPDLEEARQAASRAVKDATRAAEIIGKVRRLYQKDDPQRAPVDLNEVIREMISLLRNEVSRYAISVRAQLAADLPPVMGDRVQLQQVMMNLVVNSIDAMKDVEGQRELLITTQKAEKEIRVSVGDTGVGLPQGSDKVFDAFFTTKSHGTGMGLRISRSIIESHDGRLWATGNSPRGAVFHFSLPATSVNDVATGAFPQA